MNLKSLATAVGSFAPTLATMLGGPLAGTAVTALESAFGLAPGAGADAITQVIQTSGMTPELIAKIRAADQQHAEAIKKAELDLVKINADHEEAFAKIGVDDRESARKREEIVKDWTPRIVAIGVLAITLGLEGSMLLGFHRPTQIAPEILGRIFGTLDSATIVILSYYFGSSAGARSSAESLAQIAKQP